MRKAYNYFSVLVGLGFIGTVGYDIVGGLLYYAGLKANPVDVPVAVVMLVFACTILEAAKQVVRDVYDIIDAE